MHEINLLPPERRQSLRREVTINSLLYTLSSLTFAVLAMTAVAAACWAGLTVYGWRLEATGQEQVDTTITEYQQLRDQIAERNQLLEYIQGISANRLSWADLVADVLTTVPPGIEIGGITGTAALQGNTINEALFTMSGQAAVRSGLIIFADRLRLVPGVTAVDAPNSNLIKRENPLYRFNIHVDPMKRHEENTTNQPAL